MRVQECVEDGKPAFRVGRFGPCYTYEAGNTQSRNAAKRHATIVVEEENRIEGLVKLSRSRWTKSFFYTAFDWRFVLTPITICHRKYGRPAGDIFYHDVYIFGIRIVRIQIRKT